MKSYCNGQRKAKAYGGEARRKPMMYGGMATKKKKKKMANGGTANQMSANMMNPQAMQNPMGMAQMAGGGKLKMVKKGDKMVPFYAADGKGKA